MKSFESLTYSLHMVSTHYHRALIGFHLSCSGCEVMCGPHLVLMFMQAWPDLAYLPSVISLGPCLEEAPYQWFLCWCGWLFRGVLFDLSINNCSHFTCNNCASGYYCFSHFSVLITFWISYSIKPLRAISTVFSFTLHYSAHPYLYSSHRPYHTVLVSTTYCELFNAQGILIFQTEFPA